MNTAKLPDNISEKYRSSNGQDLDLSSYYERAAGSLVVDPRKAQLVFGEDISSALKLSEDGKFVLWPQPTDDPADPQNWNTRRKSLQLAIITLTAIVPEFDIGIGVASLFWALLCNGIGGIFAIILSRRIGRLPVLFWLLIGCTLAHSLVSFSVMRSLTAFCAACPHVTGLLVINDMCTFHLKARKVCGHSVIISSFLSPFILGFLVPTGGWAYTVGVIYSSLILCLITVFGRETRFERSIPSSVLPRRLSMKFDVSTLLGLSEKGVLFSFAIGMNVTTSVLLGEKPPLGYSYGQYAISGIYATPVISSLAGHWIAGYLNDFIVNSIIRRNQGVFEAESRLWMYYFAVLIYVVGLFKLLVAVVIIGWAMRQVAVALNTVAVYAYANDCFPKYNGEVSGLMSLFRALAGFSMAYIQAGWVNEKGALQAFGCEAS
ncbi:hypothetical protein M422DRAFT_61133 [Sphaerobolus stellatus SS14]|uniref:Major facilitator superfamily (MFS) profile domain-containing protein n=1 Tax=Sphaerobolus stellatus (strain SS14) TaxID=990650 RepID=A0A0C9VG42_SPHS4|nr:hypothetical protein M422DRAFT_61133 [Sphaerobolus stellatus SS14]